jgi:(1->4)-alpha-D-glucan 1-alpha-D-glucosylmutase
VRVPASTYRLQINADFPFARVRERLDYFQRLGVGALYFAPVFQARERSPHGYDVTNPAQFNREVGDQAQFEDLSALTHARGLGILLDIVPNHMAASEANPWWRDILEHGPASLAAGFFDVEWDAPHAGSRIVLPVLGAELDEVLEKGELQLDVVDGGFVIRYFARSFPVDPNTYPLILEHLENIDPALLEQARAIGPRSAATVQEQAARRDSGLRLKQALRDQVRDFHPGPAPYLRELIAKQAYRLEYWRTGTRILNYRRFFDVTDLAGVCVEDADVFAVTHSLILELIRSGQIDGVRVDHVDGLRDPAAYLEKLRQAVGDTYVVVEKILAPEEDLRQSWPVEGTTGYDFCGLIAALYCEPAGLSALTDSYHARTGLPPFADIAYEKKKLVIEALFAGELGSLAYGLQRLAGLCGSELASDTAAALITEVTACLPVYRTYVTDPVDNRDRAVITSAVNAARTRGPGVPEVWYRFLSDVLMGDGLPDGCERRRAEFIASWQQFTGPVTAKGLEDTAFYAYHRLIALSEVGAHPDAIATSAGEFHHIMACRADAWPHTMNASSTHDTKRSEDVRARIQVLTEMPHAWERAVDSWRRIAKQHVVTVAGELQPGVNEQLLIYQTLLGVWPLHERERAELPDRLRGFLQKSAREAKQHSSWLDPDEAYEQALVEFTVAMLADPGFMQTFAPLQQDIAWYGALNSLSQLVIKLAAPGVPDIYQGNESWVYSLVDPDNRRPVDYTALNELLSSLPMEPDAASVAAMFDQWQDGRIKMHVTRCGLQLRRSSPELFANGGYQAVTTRGRFSNNVIAFARRGRRLASDQLMVVAGRYYTRLGQRPLGPAWGDTALDLPADASPVWRNVLTGEVTDGRSLEAVFSTLPFALLLPA